MRISIVDRSKEKFIFKKLKRLEGGSDESIGKKSVKENRGFN